MKYLKSSKIIGFQLIFLELSFQTFECKINQSQLKLTNLTEREKLELAYLEQDIIYGIYPDIYPPKNATFSDEVIQSSPGCPPILEGSPWVYHRNNVEDKPKCFLAGLRGPCPEHMTLFAEPFSDFGYCDCKCKGDEDEKSVITDKFKSFHKPSVYCLAKTKKNRYRDERILAYVQKWKSCHVIFEQGFCPPGEWLVFGLNPTLGPFCEPRRCPPSSETDKLAFYDFKDKKCHTVGDSCGKREDYTFLLNTVSWKPNCDRGNGRENTVSASFLGVGITPNYCKQGEKMSRHFKICLPIITRKHVHGTRIG